jgi:hypothetical protein
MAFDLTRPADAAVPGDLSASDQTTICDLTGPERFVVWSLRWCASRHEDTAFADLCLRDSFERAGLAASLPALRRYASLVAGEPAHCPAAARLGCWRINAAEAHTLQALASLQADRFGDAWRALTAVCARFDAARAMLALGEIADALSAMGARIRAWTREPPSLNGHA